METMHMEYDATTYGIVDMAEIAAGDISVKHRKDVAVPMFGSLLFICKDSCSANILVNYLQNNMGFQLTYKDCSLYSLISNNNEQIHVCTVQEFEKMRGCRYQAIFIQNNIYNRALADKVSLHSLWVNELIPPMDPWVFRFPDGRRSKI